MFSRSYYPRQNISNKASCRYWIGSHWYEAARNFTVPDFATSALKVNSCLKHILGEKDGDDTLFNSRDLTFIRQILIAISLFKLRPTDTLSSLLQRLTRCLKASVYCVAITQQKLGRQVASIIGKMVFRSRFDLEWQYCFHQ